MAVINSTTNALALLFFQGDRMKIFSSFIMILSIVSSPLSAAKNNPLTSLIKEPVSMMDLGILKLNSSLSRPNLPGLQGATIGANYNDGKGTIDIKVSMPVKKASKTACQKIIKSTKKLFVKNIGKHKTSNIHYYFQHEGSGYRRDINWNDVAKRFVITGIALTGKNFQDSVYCQSNLMKDKVTF